MAKVCVFGAGAIGGYLAARLLKDTAHEIAVVARGEQLQAIASAGLTLQSGDEEFVVHPHAVTGTPADLPPQDLVFVTMKAHSQPAAARDVAALLGPKGMAVFVNNGIPWWWDWQGHGQPGAALPLLDPQGTLWSAVRPERALGCVIYSANEVVRPGVVRHATNNQWLLGEPDGSASQRLQMVTALMREAGLHAEAVPDIRRRIWLKLLRNAPLNSICALTRLSVDEMGRHPELAALCGAVIEEIAAIAASQGVDIADHVETAKRAPHVGVSIDGSNARNVRPSMLQDVLAGRTMEVEAILGQVQAFARGSDVPCPCIDLLLPLVRGLDQSA